MSGPREAHASSVIRLNAARRPDWTLWRNNVGVLVDKTGRPVRYGLANESAAQNAVLKSSDFIGWRSVLITPDMVGTHIAQFVSPEAKREGWAFNPNDDHEAAQAAWHALVNRAGGLGFFTTGELP